jgi:DUF1365 family protein
MKSCIYEGSVHHKRSAPNKHSFQNRIFLMYLDLDELDQVFGCHWFWSARKAAFARFRRGDHLGDPNQPLADSVRDLVAESGRPRPKGSIRLLTHLRYFGYVMNPVSFYYCFDSDNNRVETVVAEVNNTPWDEQHCYVLDPDQFDERSERRTLPKEFHVSPFLPMDLEYRWRLSEPNSVLKVNLENLREDEKVLQVSMSMKRREITTSSLSRALVLYPLMTYRVVASIYWQAFRMWMKRFPFYPHPKKTATLDSRLSLRERTPVRRAKSAETR